MAVRKSSLILDHENCYSFSFESLRTTFKDIVIEILDPMLAGLVAMLGAWPILEALEPWTLRGWCPGDYKKSECRSRTIQLTKMMRT